MAMPAREDPLDTARSKTVPRRRERLPKETMRAVFDDQLEQFLGKLGLLARFKRGELKCKFCQTTITLENLHSMFPQSGDVKFVDDRPECVRELGELLRDGSLSL